MAAGNGGGASEQVATRHAVSEARTSDRHRRVCTTLGYAGPLPLKYLREP